MKKDKGWRHLVGGEMLFQRLSDLNFCVPVCRKDTGTWDMTGKKYVGSLKIF